MFRQYKRLGKWETGYCSHATEQLQGTEKKPVIKHCVSMVPADGQLHYYKDLDLVVSRLTKAGQELVRRYNALDRKRSVEWKDEICRQEWVGYSGVLETTIHQVQLSLYAFNSGKGGVAQLSDVKVRPPPPDSSSLTRLILSVRPPGFHQDGHHGGR